jgi:redox-sensitive bicupin YhaK (pirin superfamily)
VLLDEITEVRCPQPNLGRHVIARWCFVDYYGPDDIAAEPGMAGSVHPHIGLQTVR